MGVIWTIVLGFVIGVVAKLLHPGKENMGFIMTIVLGIAGSLLAGIIGQFLGWYHAGEGAGDDRQWHPDAELRERGAD